MSTLLLDGMQGLGDNLYQRPIVRHLAESHTVALVTPWPQLYADLPVQCVKPNVSKLRTQRKNMLLSARNLWQQSPRAARSERLCYVNHSGTILDALGASVGVKPDRLDMSGPPTGPNRVDRPYVLVRPVTLRSEWRADARNPAPEYVAQAADAFRAAGFTVVSVADLADGHEWAVDPIPASDVRFHKGELSITDLLALVAGATAIVGGVGWIAPAAMAYRVPTLLIFGGWGYHNGPQRILDDRIDSSFIQCVIPDNFCMCQSAWHDCDKTVTDIGEQIGRFIDRVSSAQTADMAS